MAGSAGSSLVRVEVRVVRREEVVVPPPGPLW